MRIISIANQKGGCGKTTTAVNLSSSLAHMGYRVLLLDMDPQGHATICLRPDLLLHAPSAAGTESRKPNLFDVLVGGAAGDGNAIVLEDAMVEAAPQLYLAAASTRLIRIEQQDIFLPRKELTMRHLLTTLRNPFDFVIFDCPPSLGILTTNALLASREVIVSVETSFLSLHGVSLFLESIQRLKERYGHSLRIMALATMFDRRTLLAKDVLRDISGYFKDRLFDTVIHHNVALREASSHGMSVHRYDSSAAGAKDYLAMAQELVMRRN